MAGWFEPGSAWTRLIREPRTAIHQASASRNRWPRWRFDKRRQAAGTARAPRPWLEAACRARPGLFWVWSQTQPFLPAFCVSRQDRQVPQKGKKGPGCASGAGLARSGRAVAEPGRGWREAVLAPCPGLLARRCSGRAARRVGGWRGPGGEGGHGGRPQGRRGRAWGAGGGGHHRKASPTHANKRSFKMRRTDMKTGACRLSPHPLLREAPLPFSHLPGKGSHRQHTGTP